MEKAVDCLRIITTGNDANKRALVDIPIALPGLMRLLAEPKAVRCCLGTLVASRKDSRLLACQKLARHTRATCRSDARQQVDPARSGCLASKFKQAAHCLQC